MYRTRLNKQKIDGIKIMTVTFTLVSGTAPTTSLFSATSKNQNLTYESINIEQEDLAASTQQNENSDNKQWVHKYRALFAAAMCPQIHSICFLPANPDQSQLLYAQRGKDLFQMEGFITASKDISEASDTQDFQISNAISMSQTTWDLNPAVKHAVRVVLSHLLLDNETLGIALNFPNIDNKSSTYLWTKCC